MYKSDIKGSVQILSVHYSHCRNVGGIRVPSREDGVNHCVIFEIYYGNKIKVKIITYQKKMQLIMELDKVALYRQNYLMYR